MSPGRQLLELESGPEDKRRYGRACRTPLKAVPCSGLPPACTDRPETSWRVRRPRGIPHAPPWSIPSGPGADLFIHLLVLAQMARQGRFAHKSVGFKIEDDLTNRAFPPAASGLEMESGASDPRAFTLVSASHRAEPAIGPAGADGRRGRPSPGEATSGARSTATASYAKVEICCFTTKPPQRGPWP